jgi:hypothetical protein
MKVFFEQSGGLTGIDAYATVDSDELPPEEVSELQQLLDDTNLLQLPSQSLNPTRGAVSRFWIESRSNDSFSLKN